MASAAAAQPAENAQSSNQTQEAPKPLTFRGLPGEMRNMVYISLVEGAVIKYSYNLRRGPFRLISEIPKNPKLRATLATLAEVDEDLGNEAMGLFTELSRPEFENIHQMSLIYDAEGPRTELETYQWKDNVRVVGFSKLEPGRHAGFGKLVDMVKNMPLLREVAIVPSKVPQNSNPEPDAFYNQQRWFIRRILAKKDNVMLFREMKKARHEGEERARVTFRADWDDAFEAHENNRPKCRKLAASGGRLTAEVRLRQTEELRVYFDEQLDQALDGLFRENVERDTRHVVKLNADLAKLQADIAVAEKERIDEETLWASNA